MRKHLATFALFLASIAAQAEPIATQVTSAENAIETSNHRLFVSSDGAFYELAFGNDGWAKTKVPAAFRDGANRSCYFLGIAELNGRVYTVCTADNVNPLAKKFLLALDTLDATPVLQEVGELHGVALPNGLTVDNAGNMYVADSGLPLLPGTIQKITLASAYTISTQTTFHRFLAFKPNGLRYAQGKLYVTVNPFSYIGVSQLLRYDLRPDGLRNETALYKSVAFLDDFTLVEGGAVMTEFLGGRITHVSERGTELHRAGFTQPTSVSLLNAPAYGAGNLLVTERSTGNVHRFMNSWGLRPR
ncbi:MAG TPA: hypothetical protein VEC35_04710 [Noviherbaspirillum sp.]|nr:hypothetical protein [Noviherbaspirillum sp.]